MFQTKYCCQMSSFTKQRRVKDFVTMVIFWSIAIWFTSLSVSFCTKRVFCFGRKLWNSFDSTSTTYVQGQLRPNLALFWSASQTTHFYPTNLHNWQQHIWKLNNIKYPHIYLNSYFVSNKQSCYFVFLIIKFIVFTHITLCKIVMSMSLWHFCICLQNIILKIKYSYKCPLFTS